MKKKPRKGTPVSTTPTVGDIGICLLCRKPLGDRSLNHAQCWLWRTQKPRSGGGSPSVNDVPLHLNGVTLHRYVDIGFGVRRRMEDQQRRYPHHYDRFLETRNATITLDLEALTQGRVLSRNGKALTP